MKPSSSSEHSKKQGLLGPLLFSLSLLTLFAFILISLLPSYLLPSYVKPNAQKTMTLQSVTRKLITAKSKSLQADLYFPVEQPQPRLDDSAKPRVTNRTRWSGTGDTENVAVRTEPENSAISPIKPTSMSEVDESLAGQPDVNHHSVTSTRVIQGEVIVKQLLSANQHPHQQLDVNTKHITEYTQVSHTNRSNQLATAKAAIASQSACNKPVSVTYHAEQASEELFIISQLKYGSMIMSDELFAYQQGGKQYLPIQLLAELLLLPIQLDTDTQTVTGWFQEQDKQIHISDGLMVFWANGTQCEPLASELFFDEWDLYLERQIIENMFGLSIHFEASRQRFLIDESDSIPLTQLIARKKRFDLFSSLKKQKESIKISEIAREDAMIGDLAMSMDLGITSQNKAEHEDTAVDGFVQARTDVAGHNIYAGYSWSDTGETVNAYIEKTLADSWVKHYRVGSIESHSIPLISESSEGVGIRITAGDGFTEDFRSITVEGEIEPDWDVELYRNNSLVSVQRVGQDARYRFIDVPFYIGMNQYQLRFFGPNGESRTETFSKVLDHSVMEEGTLGVSYGSMVREIDDLQQHYLNANWAVSDGFTAGLSLVHQEISEGEWLTLPKLSVNLLAGQNLIQVNHAASEDGYATGLIVQGSSGEIDWLADWELYDEFSSWENDINSLHQQAQVSLNGSFDLLPLSWTLSGNWRDYVVATDYLQLSGLLSGQIDRIAFSNEVRWQKTPIEEFVYNRVAASGRVNDWYLRTYLDLSVAPNLEVNQWVINANSTLTDRFNYQVELNYQPQADDPFSIRNSISYLFDHSSLRFVVDNYSSGDWFTQLKWNSSLLWQPETNLWLLDRVSHLNTGAVKIIAFQDDNANGIFDNEELGVGGLSFSGHSKASDVTSESGELLITHLQTTRPQRLVLKESSLPDPFLIPLMSGITVNPHPGNIQQILYPILYTAELEGSVLKLAAGVKLPAKGSPIILLDRLNHREYKTRVEFDGVFILDRLLPGQYELSVGNRFISTLELLPGEYHELEEIVLEGNID